MPPATRSIQDLVTRLAALPAERISVPLVTDLLTEAPLDEASLAPFIHWRDETYARNLIHRDALFDVMLLCWRPGQATPVHNHSGQMGWVQLVRGALEETCWGHAGGNTTPDLSAVDVDDDGVGHGLSLERTGYALASESGQVVSVDRQRAIHALGHPRPDGDGEGTVSLHVYSRPHDTCVRFDPEAGTCRRVELAFFTAPEGWSAEPPRTPPG